MLRAIGNTGAIDEQLTGTFDRGGRLRNGRPAAGAAQRTGEFCLACFTGWYAVPPAGPGKTVADDGGLEAGRVQRSANGRRQAEVLAEDGR